MNQYQLETVPAPTLPTPKGLNLTIKQKSFIRFYLETGNATEAARLAGYGGNDVTLASIGYELLRHPQICSEIKRLCDPIADAQEVLQRMTQYSRASIADVLTDSGSFDLQTAKQKGSDTLIKKLKFDKDTGNVTDLEIHDQKSATETLMKHHGLLADRSESVNVNIDLNGSDLAAILQGALQAGAIDVTPVSDSEREG